MLGAALTCLGPSTVFFFLVYFTRQRWWALAAALSYTLFSPLYGMVATIDRDRGNIQLPWRLLVLVKYGEGPHNAGLALLPLALTGDRPGQELEHPMAVVILGGLLSSTLLNLLFLPALYGRFGRATREEGSGRIPSDAAPDGRG